jgi:hypothetical protein
MARDKSLVLGSLIKFKDVNRELRKHIVPGWIDENNNIIPTFSIGMIVKKRYRNLRDWKGWEYDILIPSLGIVSPNWGNFAFDPLD